MNWSARPFARILFFCVLGIFLARYLGEFVQINFIWIFAITIIFLLLNFFLIKITVPWNYKFTTGLLAGMLILVMGFWNTRQKLNLPIIDPSDKNDIYSAEIVKDPVLTDKTVKTVLKVLPFKASDSSFSQEIRIMAFFSRDSLSERLKYGDQLVFNGKLAEPDPPKNPYEFDYREFLHLNEINYTVYLNSSRWKYLDLKKSFSIKLIASELRNYILRAFADAGLKGKNYAVAAAMILGYDDLMEPEVEQNYVQAGAMHILCVSGLHVGVIYFVVSFILGFLKRKGYQQIVKAVILLLVVWFYAMLTGLSPSVQRASVMLTVFIVGNAIQGERDSLNTLAASAMVMLIYDPLLIYNVGFQLSYSAVLGILLFYQPIYRLFFIKNKLIDKIWSLSVVSFAAQLGTFPLAAHYFHFFPTYFWLTNIFVLPLSFLIIGIGFFFVLVSWIPFVSSMVGFSMSIILSALNLIVDFVDYLPFNGIRNIYFPWLKVFVVYSLILFFNELVFSRKIRLMLPALLAILVLVSMGFYRNYSVLIQKRIAVYQINKHSAITFIEGEKQICLVDSILYKDNSIADFQILNSTIYWGVGRNMIKVDSSFSKPDMEFTIWDEIGVFGDYKFAIIDERKYYPSGQISQMPVDVLFIRGKKHLKLSQLKRCFQFGSIVMDGSVPYYKKKSLVEAADTLGIKYYITSESGAYIKEF